MPIINNPFNGKLNLDVADYRIDSGDYIDALNITKDAQGKGQDRVVSNIVGNTLIPYTLPSGTNKIIGFYPDKVRNRAYYCLWNSNGYNSILYYSLNSDTIVKVLESKTDSDGIDILNFNPSYKVLSMNIFYRDNEGDILYFNDGLNPPKSINISANYGTSWKAEYLLIAKAPPIMPPKVVFENDTTVTVNNLRNSLYQFSYRFVYANNEKSVWSAKSIVPLPQQPTLNLTESVMTNNCRISMSISTGGRDVKGLELSFRENNNNITSDWYLIKQLVKADNGILDNDIYTFKFYNDSIYTTIDIIQSSQLQDYVPQKANAAELANGNVLLYSGITEGYNKTQMNLLARNGTGLELFTYYTDICGLSFFATCKGNDSGTSGTVMKVYLYGTGTNTSGEVTTLNNGAATYNINVVNLSGTDIGISYNNATIAPLVSTVLTDIKDLLIAKGWSFDSLNGNILTMSYSSGFLLYSSGLKFNQTAGVPDNTVFANAWDSGYQYCLQYFDAQGRTIGAQTSLAASFNTAKNNTTPFIQTFLEIKNRPPLEADYYHILRSNNTTYNKRLFWISDTTYFSVLTAPTMTTTYDLESFLYIGIDNIDLYNKQQTSTKGIVSYAFTPGDRITFLRRYNDLGNPVAINIVDFEILGTESLIQTWQGQKEGNFIKIKYPFAAAAADPYNFAFGAQGFMNYEILLYNYSTNADVTQKTFYEFNKCFGIGNKGTSSAYHIGLEQTQSAIDPINVPAVISTTNGDLFYRKRRVPYGYKYTYEAGNQDIPQYFSEWISTELRLYFGQGNFAFGNANYEINAQAGGLEVDNAPSSVLYPEFADTGFFWNKTGGEIILSIVFQCRVTYDGLTQGVRDEFYVTYVDATSKRFEILNAIRTTDTTGAIFACDTRVVVPAHTKIWISNRFSGGASGEIAFVGEFSFYGTVLQNSIIDIIETSFSDSYNLTMNSNGRPSVIDENARHIYFPTLIRFSQSYQAETNINGTNTFYFENFDEYDRSFGDVIRLHVRDRYLKVYQKFKVGNVPILTQIIKDSANNPLQANTDQLINKIQYYAGDYGIGDAGTSLAWNNFSDYFVDNYRGVVLRLSQDGITPLSIIYNTNAFFAAKLPSYRQELNNGVYNSTGNPCIYGVFDAYTNKYIIAMEEINRYSDCVFSGGVCHLVAVIPTTTTTTTTTTTLAPKINNCITPELNNETIGVQVFVRLTAYYTLTSTVTVNVTVVTQYASYPEYNVCPNGTITSNHKFVFTSGNADESAYLVVINSISPSSDSTYNYINCI